MQKWYESDHFRFIRRQSDAAARLLDALGFTPNILTWLGLLLVPPMIGALAMGSLRLGFVLFLASAFTDGLDGALARYQEDRLSEIEKRQRDRKHMLFRKGKTTKGHWSGASIDPFVDKVRFFSAYVPFAWGNLPLIFLILPAFLLAALLTYARFRIEKEKKEGMLPQSYEPQANLFGKSKAAAENALIVAMALSALGITSLRWPIYALLAVSTILGGLSFYGQVRSYLDHKSASR